jgi:hypothetical protein
MQAEVKEIAERPSISTPGRVNAPQAAVTIAQILEQPGHNWADKADIVLDWENTLLQSDEEELKYPVMLIACSKYVPGKGHLVVQSRLNIDSVFTGDYVTFETLADIVEELRILAITKLEEAGVR